MAIPIGQKVKSVHGQAFGHYLRTGQRLTNAEWLSRSERKFNPYHDEIGRFTSPPGVTVSWGNHRPGNDRPAARPQQTARPALREKPRSEIGGKPSADPERASPASTSGSPHGEFRSDLVRSATNEAPPAETYFELNKRQAGLNRLRERAGPNPDAVTKADLDEFQRRLDADRARLDAITREIINPSTVEILRAGSAPIDTAVGAIKIAKGEAELRDYLAAASIIPSGKIGASIVKPALQRAAPAKVATEVVEPALQVVQKGGSHWKVKGMPGYHAHHIPSDKVSPISTGRGPTIAMLIEDHKRTMSYGRGPAGEAFRARQKELIDKGDFRGAQQMDIDDIRSKFGSRYDDAIEQMLEYSRQRGF